ncbi:hypothetical protein, partial [Enterobacter mori]
GLVGFFRYVRAGGRTPCHCHRARAQTIKKTPEGGFLVFKKPEGSVDPISIFKKKHPTPNTQKKWYWRFF